MKKLTKKALFFISIFFLLTILFISCSNENSRTPQDTVNNNQNEVDANNNEVYDNIETEAIVNFKEDDYKTVSYFAQWDLEEDFPYDSVDNYWHEMTENGYYKFYYDEKGTIIGHERIQNDNIVVRFAKYTYDKDKKKKIEWWKNYDAVTKKPTGCDIMTYTTDGYIKTLTETNGNNKILMKIKYGKIKKTTEGIERISRIYDGSDKEKIYIKATFIENKFDESIKYIKQKETKYIANGKYKDQWFTIVRYSQVGEINKTDENETKNDEGKTFVQYIEQDFPSYFSEAS